MSQSGDSVYERVTDRILKALDNGVVPWKQPWTTASISKGASPLRPYNAATGRAYRGVNVLLLALAGFSDCRWLTYNQAKAVGGSVRKGEHGTEIVFWKVWTKAKDDGTTSEMPLLRSFYVFNAEQIDGLEMPTTASEPALSAPDGESAAKKIMADLPSGLHLVHGGDRAFYAPLRDSITLPYQVQFESRETYYATFFHELVHATGHETRLNRCGVSGRQGEPRTLDTYGREELIAEIGATFMCAEVCLEVRISQSAAYLANWLEAIRADRRSILYAAGAAQKAVDFLLRREAQPFDRASASDNAPAKT